MGINRWRIAVAGVFMQLALGAVYAWSVFRIPLAKQFGWSISEVTLTFTISIFVLGFAAFFGGLWLNRKGPRVVAMTGGLLYGAGIFLAGFSDHRPRVGDRKVGRRPPRRSPSRRPEITRSVKRSRHGNGGSSGCCYF